MADGMKSCQVSLQRYGYQVVSGRHERGVRGHSDPHSLQYNTVARLSGTGAAITGNWRRTNTKDATATKSITDWYRRKNIGSAWVAVKMNIYDFQQLKISCFEFLHLFTMYICYIMPRHTNSSRTCINLFACARKNDIRVQ